jgi:transcriptional regulator with XRE-family HTH domain
MTTSRGDEVRRQRLLRGLEQEDLARETGVSVRTIGRIEVGQGERSRSLPVLEQFLGIEPDSVRVEAGPPASVTLGEASRLQIVQELLRREIEELQSGDVVRLPRERLGWAREDLPSAREVERGEGEHPG